MTGDKAVENTISSATVALSSGITSPYQCKGYRLPTEAEWEYAARAGEGNGYTRKNKLNSIAWHYEGGSEMIPSTGTLPVASLIPNSWCLFDVLGNTWELVYESFNSSYQTGYLENPVIDPWNSSTLPSPEEIVVMGCGYATESTYCRLANRHKTEPSKAAITYGFRLVRTIYSENDPKPEQNNVVVCDLN